MNEMTVFQEDEDKTIVSLDARRKALKTGGKEPPSGNWLGQLKPGTEYVTQGGTQNFPWLLQEWCLIGHKAGVTCVCPALSQNDPNSWMWVDPEEYSKAFRLRAVTEEP